MMGNILTEQIARNYRLPQKGPIGWYVSEFIFKKRNTFLEENAARLCKIQPDHRVLEVGFGPGVGLRTAYDYVKGGTGMVYGLDLSPAVVNRSLKTFRKEISEGRMELAEGTVNQMPYLSNYFDSVFHCNSYYFWTRMDIAAFELHRVMKPGGLLVCTLNLDRLKAMKEKGRIKYGQFDPIRYMASLEQAGLQNVNIQYLHEERGNYQAIIAEKPLSYNQES